MAFVHFRPDLDELTVLDSIRQIAANYGYTTRSGPQTGRGNVAELLAAIATGEVATVLLPDEQRLLAIEFLRSAAPAQELPLAEALSSLADELEQA